MVGTFSLIERNARLTYDTRSWTEGEEATSTIHHINDLILTGNNEETFVKLHITITKIGPKAKMAAIGMGWGYKRYLNKLDQYLSERAVT